MSEFAIEKLISRSDPLLNFLWVCQKLPFNMDENYVESISLPFPNIDVGDPLFAGGTFFHFPSFSRVDTVSMTMYEDRKMTTTKWITAWKSKIRNTSKGWYNLPSVYKRDIPVVMFDDDLSPIFKAVLIGCWPTQTSNIDLNYADSQRVIVNVTLSVDNIDFIDV